MKKVRLAHTEGNTATIPDLDERAREYAADEFAQELLMPETTFRDVWASAVCLKDVADYFGVSEMAANVRAALLGLGYFDEFNGSSS